jgi:dihydroorotate dehydrogenase
MILYSHVVRPVVFSFDAERVHDFIIDLCEQLGKSVFAQNCASYFFQYDNCLLENRIHGINFRHPIGLAAGFDKNGKAAPFLARMGFSHLEIGSISAGESSGNAKPRLFRLPKDKAIVVNYGAPSDGAEIVAERLQNRRISIPIGANIIKTNSGKVDISVDAIIEDYLVSIKRFIPVADYLSLNLSCPNVKGNIFAEKSNLNRLLIAIKELDLSIPLFLKVSPVGGISYIDELLDVSHQFSFLSGFIFNLPPRDVTGLKSAPQEIQAKTGAISGKPVETITNFYIQEAYRRMDKNRFVIIGTGGVFDAEDAYIKMKLGASLIQLFTGIIYNGPGIAKRINKGICQLLRKDGCKSIQDIIGVDSI